MTLDSTPYIAALVIGAAAYLYGKKERSDTQNYNDIKQLLAHAVSNNNKKNKKRVQTVDSDSDTSSDDELQQQQRSVRSKHNNKSKTNLNNKRGSTFGGFYPTSSAHINQLISSDDLSNDITELKNSLLRLERRNQLLSKQLALAETSNVVDIESKYAPTGYLTASEVETIRNIFNQFDQHRTGYIRTDDLPVLHKKLGEPLTDEESIEAENELDPSASGTINFNKFIYWWNENHKQGKRSEQYTNRFKLVHNQAVSENNFSIDKIVTQDSGTPYTLEYRLNFYYKQSNGELKQISPWHDVPLISNITVQNTQSKHSSSTLTLYNFVCEIPKWTRAKFEIATGEKYNPIKQDTKNGALRYYKHGDMMFNYGCFPQTWEDPSVVPDDTGFVGDNDPIDVLEIGNRQLKTGSITAVKILGVLALIDDGETDWKVIAINVNDPLAHLIHDVDDVETHIPGAIRAIREYLRDYKNYAGGSLNKYALNERAMPRDYAIRVVNETHEHWKNLHKKQNQGIKNDKVWVARSRSNSIVIDGSNTPIHHNNDENNNKQFPNNSQQQQQQKQQSSSTTGGSNSTLQQTVHNVAAVGQIANSANV